MSVVKIPLSNPIELDIFFNGMYSITKGSVWRFYGLNRMNLKNKHLTVSHLLKVTDSDVDVYFEGYVDSINAKCFNNEIVKPV